jgi:hypothetical protein
LFHFSMALSNQEEDTLWESAKKEIDRITDILREPDGMEIISKEYLDLYQRHQKLIIVSKRFKKETEAFKAKMNQGQYEKLEALARELQKKYRQVTLENKELQKYKNIELAEKFKLYLQEYHVRETHFQTILNRKNNEYHLSEEKANRNNEKYLEQLEKVKELQGKIQEYALTEQELRKQLAMYVDKFKQVEDTLNKSNELFVSFRKEMEQMSEKTLKLELENRQAWSQHESMLEEKKQCSKEVDCF